MYKEGQVFKIPVTSIISRIQIYVSQVFAILVEGHVGSQVQGWVSAASH